MEIKGIEQGCERRAGQLAGRCREREKGTVEAGLGR